ncbi:VanZ family protein [Aquimarina sediminis]|uniref:VanZ family protein n=1 Tax=Aquimarina sediminis TaxID=2070536 RepID=UPI0013E8F510|nr:VanZ family protein [Aquimarina sediminis]
MARFVYPVKIQVEGSDKYAHFIAYFTVTVAWTLYLFFSEKLNKGLRQSLIISSVASVLYGILMEVLQSLLTTYRSSDWYDVVANTCGTIFAVFIFVVLKRQVIRIKQNNQKIR